MTKTLCALFLSAISTAAIAVTPIIPVKVIQGIRFPTIKSGDSIKLLVVPPTKKSSSAKLAVTGNHNITAKANIPGKDPVYLFNKGSSKRIKIKAFTFGGSMNNTGKFKLSANNLRVGATAIVPANMPAGSYKGTIIYAYSTANNLDASIVVPVVLTIEKK
jgi:hypothetical protein